VSREGFGWRSAKSSAAPSSPAMTARAEVRNSGEKSDTATRVAGSEPLKMMTPTRPLPQPSMDDFISPFPQLLHPLSYTAGAGGNSNGAVQLRSKLYVFQGQYNNGSTLAPEPEFPRS
jgi:hypothetical protein